jgi:hypothetical protein
MTATIVHGAAQPKVVTGGTPVIAFSGPVAGGVILNPLTALDQGIAAAEPLFIDLTGPAALVETVTTMRIVPGQRFDVPAQPTCNVSVNAGTSGHKFSAAYWQPTPQFPPTPQTGTFPPSGPTGRTQVIPSYLYAQYNDDADVQAFVDAYNSMAQDYVDSFNDINLPIYTRANIQGALLDWVAEGLYGISRPTLSAGRNRYFGPFNTYLYNVLLLNQQKAVGAANVAATSDDTFKRIITWHFYKGDGKVFNVDWLKRRLQRFLIGVGGSAPNVDNTYNINVTFSGSQVNIALLQAAVFTESFILKEAIDSGALELPFQFTYSVTVTS